jgi:hypothetical protein
MRAVPVKARTEATLRRDVPFRTVCASLANLVLFIVVAPLLNRRCQRRRVVCFGIDWWPRTLDRGHTGWKLIGRAA